MKFVVALAILVAIWWLSRRRGATPGAAEARALLGVPADATADEIAAAHRRLIARVHPDAGGSAVLAQRINAARDILLAKP